MSGFRLGFRRSIGNRWFRLNFTKTGVGWSAGVPGFRVSRRSSGLQQETVSIPGTGVFWRRRRRAPPVTSVHPLSAPPAGNEPTAGDGPAEELVRRGLDMAKRARRAGDAGQGPVR